MCLITLGQSVVPAREFLVPQNIPCLVAGEILLQISEFAGLSAIRIKPSMPFDEIRGVMAQTPGVDLEMTLILAGKESLFRQHVFLSR